MNNLSQTNKNKPKQKLTNSISSNHNQSVSSDVFENQPETPNKRNLSSDEPPIPKKNKPLFVTSNRYACLNVDDDRDITTEHADPTVINKEIKTPSPPPIIVNGTNDFVSLRTNLINLIGSKNFLFKSSTNNLKILTKNSDSYRAVIKFLNEKGAEYHTYQLRENK